MESFRELMAREHAAKIVRVLFGFAHKGGESLTILKNRPHGAANCIAGNHAFGLQFIQNPQGCFHEAPFAWD